MFNIIRFFDELDDVFGILGAASSGAYLLIIFLSIVLTITATLSLGLRGLFVSLLVCGVSISVATLASSRN